MNLKTCLFFFISNGAFAFNFTTQNCKEFLGKLGIRIQHVEGEIQLSNQFYRFLENSDLRAEWISVYPFKTYFRKAEKLINGKIRNTLEISNISSMKPGSGLYSNFLSSVSNAAKEAGFEAIFIESVHDLKQDFFYKRNGFRVHNESNHLRATSYYKLLKREELATTLTQDKRESILSLLRNPENLKRANIFKDESDMKAMDLYALGFPDKYLAHSKIRLEEEIFSPPFAPDEIRMRQGAINSLLENEGRLRSELNNLMDSDASSLWKSGNRRTYRVSFLDSLQIWKRPPESRTLYQRTLSKIKKKVFDVDDEEFIRLSKLDSEFEIEKARSFFSEIDQIRNLLESTQSQRLKQIKWVLDSCFSADHLFDMAKLVSEFETAPTYKKAFDALESLLEKKKNELLLVERAYEELSFYLDVSNNAIKNKWSVFPEILDHDQSLGPILNLTNIHSPRVQSNKPENSVPNTLQLGADNVKHLIVTGPNAEGKSTLGRSIVHEIILSQMGSPVPANRARQTPLHVVTYRHPRDSPKDEMSLFMAEARVLYGDVLQRAQESPFTFVLMDEILPGTIPDIRSDVESEFLSYLAEKGVISFTATHNWGTTILASQKPSVFKNVHVDKFHLKDGPVKNLNKMYDGAIEALRRMGWPEELIQRIRSRAKSKLDTNAKEE